MTRWMDMTRCMQGFLALLILAAPPSAVAQDSNLMFPVEEIEALLRSRPFTILNMPTSRGLPSERTWAPTVQFEDGPIMQIQWAPAPRGGETFNNRPHYELGAYRLQSLFLDPEEYVVPPTEVRLLPLPFVQEHAPEVPQTFDDWFVSLVVLQYWLFNVDVGTTSDIRDRDRMEEDPRFERHVAHLNLLTFLIDHQDSNEGNFLISTDPDNPRVFAVDNGVAFESEASDRGQWWSRIRVDRFPQDAIERLRGVTIDSLHATLGVLAQWEMIDGQLQRVPPTENLDPDKGIRREGNVLQIGLEARAIRNVDRRLRSLIGWIDDGRYEVF